MDNSSLVRVTEQNEEDGLVAQSGRPASEGSLHTAKESLKTIRWRCSGLFDIVIERTIDIATKKNAEK
jgi:hypothetical protein